MCRNRAKVHVLIVFSPSNPDGDCDFRRLSVRRYNNVLLIVVKNIVYYMKDYYYKYILFSFVQ